MGLHNVHICIHALEYCNRGGYVFTELSRRKVRDFEARGWCAIPLRVWLAAAVMLRY